MTAPRRPRIARPGGDEPTAQEWAILLDDPFPPGTSDAEIFALRWDFSDCCEGREEGWFSGAKAARVSGGSGLRTALKFSHHGPLSGRVAARDAGGCSMRPGWRPEPCAGQAAVRFWHDDGRYPELRRRLGGIGTPKYEALANHPLFSYGLPLQWVTQEDVDLYNGRAKDPYGMWMGTHTEGSFPYHAIDPDDPPLFEAEATYLERHGLLLPGERELLTEADFEPEAVLH